MVVKAGYKQTEVGVIPEDWDVKNLGSILLSMRLGGNYPNQDVETSKPLIKMGNISRGYIDLKKIEYIPDDITPEFVHKLQHGDVLFNTRNTLDLVGKVAIWKNELPEAYYNSNLMRLKFDSENISSNEYANYLLNAQSSLLQLRNIAIGTTSVAAIYTRDLLKIVFPIPQKKEQHAIATALSDADALITSLDQLIAKKRDLKQAAMQELLTGKRRLPGFSGEWEGICVRDVTLRFLNGGTPSTKNEAFWGGDIPWTTSAPMISFYLDYGESMITPLALEKSSSNLIPKNNVIIATRVGIGKVVENRIDIAINQDLTGLLLIREKISPSFFVWLFLSHNYNQLLLSLSRGTTIKGISRKELEEITFLLPSLNEQSAIISLLSSIDSEITGLEQQRKKTKAIKQGMMQELITGRIRLK